jgi:hypothetical protein
MKGLVSLFIGLFGTFAFSWVGLTVIPNLQIGALNPQMDEEGTDIYPAPKSGMADRGRRIYAANGCIYCHSQQIRPEYASADIDRVRDAGPSPRPKWAERRSAPRDYIFDRPVVLGQERMGPELPQRKKTSRPQRRLQALLRNHRPRIRARLNREPVVPRPRRRLLLRRRQVLLQPRPRLLPIHHRPRRLHRIQPAYRRLTPRPGIIDIFMRRAA